jgi:hypothetical protein
MKCFKSPVWDSYQIINFIFAGIVACIMLYSGFFSDIRANHPIPCIHEKLTGKQCPSCGISRSFSAIVRGKWDEADVYNPNGKRVFVFFALQFLMRIVISLWIIRFPLTVQYTWKVDALVSLLMFVYCFWGLMKGMAVIFSLS